MPKAEVGSTKYIANKLKSKGLQRLRWYCQACERQMRDENGFKCHVQSESHYRQMLVLGENPNKAYNEFSNQFKHDFVQLLRTSHNTKMVHINHFYQEYIANKEHVHMNATKWTSLTEFAKYLGKEGICRVEENEKGIHIAWIDNSPEALRRQEAVRKRERQDKGDEEREQKLIEQQIKRANHDKGDKYETDEDDEEKRHLQRNEGEKISLSFGKPKQVSDDVKNDRLPTPPETSESGGSEEANVQKGTESEISTEEVFTTGKEEAKQEPQAAPVKLSFGSGQAKPKNVFSAKKNPLGSKKSTLIEQPKKMSEAERIMREELERKRPSQQGGFSLGAKRQKVG